MPLNHRVILLASIGIAGTACASRPKEARSEPKAAPPGVVYAQPFPESCPEVDPADSYWEGSSQDLQTSGPGAEAKASIDLHPEFSFIRATLFVGSEARSAGCLRVDVKSPPGAAAVNVLEVALLETAVVVQDQPASFRFGQAPPDVIYSLGVAVQCTSEERDDCLRGKVRVEEVTLNAEGARVPGAFGAQSEVGIRRGR